MSFVSVVFWRGFVLVGPMPPAAASLRDLTLEPLLMGPATVGAQSAVLLGSTGPLFAFTVPVMH